MRKDYRTKILMLTKLNMKKNTERKSDGEKDRLTDEYKDWTSRQTDKRSRSCL
jgi:hypothetical protein